MTVNVLEDFEAAKANAASAEKLVKRIEALTGKANWPPWWRAVLGKLWAADSATLQTIEDLVHYAEQCADPDIRTRKDLGELKDPNGYLVSRLVVGAGSVWKRNKLGRWPDFPEVQQHGH